MFSKIQPPMDETEQMDSQGVGELLRQMRQKNGEELRDVAEILCIRFLYLVAIEEGKFEDLPGATYAVGFIRGYAQHLGLDSEEIIRLYKAETDDTVKTSELAFPMPVSESEIPGGAILFIAVLVAALAYGGWYVSSSNDGFLTEQVSAVPEHLAETTIDTPPALEETKPTPADEIDKAVEETAEQPATTEDFLAGLEKQIGETNETTEPSEEAKIEAAPKVNLPPKDLTSPQEAVVEEKTAPEPSPEVEVAKTPEPEPEPEPGQQTATPPESAAEPAANTVAGRVFGAPKGESRILVRAKKSSWIQVRDDKSKKLVLTRLLRRGDSYRVPDREGLRLLTGNVSALEIIIDGKAAPPLKSEGNIRSSIALDVEKLLEGTAVTD